MKIQNDINVASMVGLRMKKDELIKILKENKEKHDTIFQAAIEGYWEEAKTKIEKKKEEFKKEIANLSKDVEYQFSKYTESLKNEEPIKQNAYILINFNFSNNLDIVYPENHSDDYEKAIRKLELSIFDEVDLSEGEYETYVLNNWKWRESFLSSNSLYLKKIEDSADDEKSQLLRSIGSTKKRLF